MFELNTVEQVEHMKEKEDLHIPVMPEEVIQYLNLQPGQCIVDCTLGCGGHALSIVKKIGAQGRLIGLDRDQDSLKIAQEKLKDYAFQCHLINDDYRNIDKVLNNLG